MLILFIPLLAKLAFSGAHYPDNACSRLKGNQCWLIEYWLGGRKLINMYITKNKKQHWYKIQNINLQNLKKNLNDVLYYMFQWAHISLFMYTLYTNNNILLTLAIKDPDIPVCECYEC